MQRTLFLFLFLLSIGCSQKKVSLFQDYNFLVSDGEISKLHQSNDTLYELHCYINQPCQTRPEKHYKILSSQELKNFIILRLERLDTIPLTINSYPPTRYSVGVIKDINNNKLGYLQLILGLTKQQIDTVQIDIRSLNNKFFFTFYSDTYLKEFSSMKKVITKNDVLEIVDALKSDQFKLLAEKYSKTEIGDMYGSGFSAEILNRACIEKGFDPIGAGRIINKLMRDQQSK